MRFHNKVTLVELLEEVAIIGVLVAISIPIFTSQLEKAREATDEANIRAAYAQVSAAVLTEETCGVTDIGKDMKMKVTKAADTGIVTGEATVKLCQRNNGLQSGATTINIGGILVNADRFQPGKYIKITIKSDGTASTIVTAAAELS